MFTTWSSANRIVTQPLTTTFTREFFPLANVNQGGAFRDWQKSYWLYTRIRKKKYKYVGMDKATAVSCAMAMNLLYNRFVPAEWIYDESISNHWRSGYINSQTGVGGKFWKFQTCGVATISKESKDDRYSVEVDVDEELPFRFGCVRGTSESDWTLVPVLIWSDFEANPDIVTPRFATGKDTGSDFTYDEET